MQPSQPLSRFERRVLEALIASSYPPTPTARATASSAGAAQDPGDPWASIVEEVIKWLSRFNPRARTLVRMMLLGYGLTPVASRHLKPYPALTPEQREAWNAGSSSTRFRARREAFNGLQSLLGVVYSSMAEVQASFGYDGAPAMAVDWTSVAPAGELPVVAYPELQPGAMEVDVVVVGSGAGGAVAAYTLAKAGLSVVVVEEGGYYNRDYFRSEGAMSRLSSLYRDNGITSTIGKPVISLPMGRAVGGTTVINSGTCFRTPESVLRSWMRTGIPGISPGEMMPFFEAVESMIGVGPSDAEALGANAAVFRRGAESLGYSGGAIKRNARGCHGHGVCCFGCPLDAKQGMHVSYLPAAISEGAKILAGARVERLQIEDGRATGVEVRIGDPATGEKRGTVTIRAKATVLAAGAVFTPALLMRQGLARSSGQLGRNLVIHPGSGTTALFGERLEAWRGVMQSWYVDEKLEGGILLEATFPPPGISYSAGSLPSDGAKRAGGSGPGDLYPYVASCGSIISDEPGGRISLFGKSGTPMVRYSLSEADARKVVEGVAMAAEIYFAAGAKEVYTMLPGLSSIHSPSEVRLVREGRYRPDRLKLSAYHPMGSARLGARPSDSVVGPWGAVWDLPGAYIMDASIIPSSTRVNPQVTIMALAARCAAKLAEEST